ncbi:hypothetical protein CCAL9344_05530 [Campylobacter sp. RM9344]|uniref:Motility integral membrane protein n=1 Tax=Campylobacter californiensis TaxID=1032243 RepID=A0AAW3ZUH4_9BACT|nr:MULTISPECIES: hypothetical protein [unclassified Campylobacter]MBE2984373.1 hypothetical protein [Campylobacter sp. RM6883]MBE2985711.1 hypothetical protein [Campylobacter sp. RM12919]MBE2988769.1 hypothetical protein [Campylobacter sp. RM12920]MBE2995808.1 hypothetical protein [Campylobacter sp. RM6913]MBE3029639.1 hypothetical protein [Campylobacter sp. RM9344]
MKAENFIAFFTVCGFFIGMVFTLIKLNDPIEMLVYTMLITFFFYLVIHIIIMNYIDVGRTVKRFFDRDRHEEVADYLISELAIREKRMDNVMSKLTNSDKISGKQNARIKAKAA